MQLFFTPGIVVIYHRLSHPRNFILFGAILAPVGLILLSSSTNNIMLCVFSAMSGLGQGIVSVCSVMLLDEFAGQTFNLYYSLAMTGFSPGMVLQPLMADALRNAYGWRSAVLILGCTMLNLVPAAMTIKKVPPRTSREDHLHDLRRSDPSAILDNVTASGLREDSETLDNVSTESRQFLDSSKQFETSAVEGCGSQSNRKTKLLENIFKWFKSTDFYKDPYFNFTIISFGLSEFVYTGWHTFLVPHCLQRDISIKGTLIITFTAAIGNLSGRLLVVFLTHGILDPTNMYLAVTVLNIAGLTCDAFVARFYIMVITSCFSAGAIAGRAVLGPLVARNRASPGNFPTTLCAMQISAGVLSLLGGYTSGLVADNFLTFDATFKLLAFVEVFVFVFMLAAKLGH